MQWRACNCKHGCGWCPTLFAQSMDRKWSIVTCYFINLIIMHIVILHTEKRKSHPGFNCKHGIISIGRSLISTRDPFREQASCCPVLIHPRVYMFFWTVVYLVFLFEKTINVHWEVSVISSLIWISRSQLNWVWSTTIWPRRQSCGYFVVFLFVHEPDGLTAGDRSIVRLKRDEFDLATPRHRPRARSLNSYSASNLHLLFLCTLPI